jgi:hypothetical protein
MLKRVSRRSGKRERAPQRSTASEARAVARVTLMYSTNGGTTWIPAATLAGNPVSYNWRVPSVTTTKAKVQVILKDQFGSMIGSDQSNNSFTVTK